MKKRLFLVCPTDCLEGIINQKFKSINFFYTSVGNSFSIDNKTVDNIKELVIKYDIKNIDFILSLDNTFISNNSYLEIKLKDSILNRYQQEIKEKKEQVKIIDQEENNQYLLLSYILNDKIKQLEHQLADCIEKIKIGAKVYNRDVNDFENIYSELINFQKYNMN